MSEISKYTKCLSCRDLTLKVINIFNKQCSDAELGELANCLLAHPDVVTCVLLGYNKLTDETGVKLVQYVAASSTIQVLNISNNQFSETTYLALAVILCVNSSLQYCHLEDNQTVDRTRIDAAFVDALRLNPVRPAGSVWSLYSFMWFSDVDFKRLKDAAEKSTPPSMLEFLLCVHLDIEKIETKIH
jgi:hypothetical protein